MNPGWLRMFPLLLLLLVSIMLTLGLFGGRNAAETSRMVGRPMPGFSVPVMASSEELTPQTWRGKVALLNIFATWCEPCNIEHPVLMRLAEKKQLPLYGIAWKDKQQQVAYFLSSKGNPYQTTGVDAQGLITTQLALTGVPETFIVDKRGRIAWHTKAPLTDEMVNETILPLVAKLNAADSE